MTVVTKSTEALGNKAPVLHQNLGECTAVRRVGPSSGAATGRHGGRLIAAVGRKCRGLRNLQRSSTVAITDRNVPTGSGPDGNLQRKLPPQPDEPKKPRDVFHSRNKHLVEVNDTALCPSKTTMNTSTARRQPTLSQTAGKPQAPELRRPSAPVESEAADAASRPPALAGDGGQEPGAHADPGRSRARKVGSLAMRRPPVRPVFPSRARSTRSLPRPRRSPRREPA